MTSTMRFTLKGAVTFAVVALGFSNTATALAGAGVHSGINDQQGLERRELGAGVAGSSHGNEIEQRSYGGAAPRSRAAVALARRLGTTNADRFRRGLPPLAPAKNARGRRRGMQDLALHSITVPHFPHCREG